MLDIRGHYAPGNLFGCAGAQFAADESPRFNILATVARPFAFCIVPLSYVHFCLFILFRMTVLFVLGVGIVLPLGLVSTVVGWTLCLPCCYKITFGEDYIDLFEYMLGPVYFGGAVGVGICFLLLMLVDLVWLPVPLLLFLPMFAVKSMCCGRQGAEVGVSYCDDFCEGLWGSVSYWSVTVPFAELVFHNES